MSESQNSRPFLEMNTNFIKTKRGMLKVAEMSTFFVAFVCFTAVLHLKYSAAAALEFLMTMFMLLWYLFKLNKMLTFFCWPLVDLFNSMFAALYFTVLSSMALTSYRVTGALLGGIFGLVAVGLLCVDGFLLFRCITFNQPRSPTSPTPGN
ncbi:proteolipid protein 2 [Nelusetta ayraudi]|uniref:proteolipid protein 2 n=1 Tax=Nelusetta ayraudi TaxID=303726 RepID=UPI003F71789D